MRTHCWDLIEIKASTWFPLNCWLSFSPVEGWCLGFAVCHRRIWLRGLHPVRRKLAKFPNQGRNPLLDSILCSVLVWSRPTALWARIAGNREATSLFWHPGKAWSDGSGWGGSCKHPCRCQSPQGTPVTRNRLPRWDRKVALRYWNKGNRQKRQTPLHPGSLLGLRFSWFHFRNDQPLIIKSELLGKWS